MPATLDSPECREDFQPWMNPRGYKQDNSSVFDWTDDIHSGKDDSEDWSREVRSEYDVPKRVRRVFLWHHRNRHKRTRAAKRLRAKFGLLSEAEKRRPEFNLLAEQWRNETRFTSSADQKILHPAYQSIIAMGRAAVPLVLEELQNHRGHWFWALRFMTGHNASPESENVNAAREAWLEWGRHEGLLP
jgi:hypothetical protein